MTTDSEMELRTSRIRIDRMGVSYVVLHEIKRILFKMNYSVRIKDDEDVFRQASLFFISSWRYKTRLAATESVQRIKKRTSKKRQKRRSGETTRRNLAGLNRLRKY